MKRSFLFFLLIFIRSFLFSDVDYYQLAATKAEPSSYVGGLVNVITGDVVFAENFLQVEGSQPISLPHLYSSRSPRIGAGVIGWHSIYSGAAIYRPTLNILQYFDKDGVSFVYHLPEETFKNPPKHGSIWSEKKNTLQRLQLNEACFKAGLTNCSSGEISGRYNLKNNKLFLRWESPLLEVHQANGSQLTFISYDSVRFNGPKLPKDCSPKSMEKALKNYQIPTNFFYLQSEKLPSGNKLIYSYTTIPSKQLIRLNNITATTPSGKKVLAFADFTYSGPQEEHFSITTSDGKSVSFFLQKKGDNQFLLKDIAFSYRPKVVMSYDTREDRAFITQKKLPQNRLVEFLYDEKNRVKELKAPLGKEGAMRTWYRFSYEEGEFGVKGGITTVYDAKDNKTQYFYSPFLRLEKICHYDKDKLSYIEKLAWGKSDTPEATCLLCKSYLDASGNGIFAKRFFYDSVGNIIKERFYGRLSDKASHGVSFNAEGIPEDKDIEFWEKKKTYATDGSHLLLQEEDETGYRHVYAYLPKTDLVVSELICDKEKIKIRHFYEYDADNILVRQIQDDGSSPDKENLSHVTERKIITINPRKKAPFFGKPESVEEKYVDLSSQQECLVKKTVFTYDMHGKVTQEDIFDSQGEYRYSHKYSYDEKERLLQEVDALQQVTSYAYDANFNKTQEVSLGLTHKYTYDNTNRIIASEDIGVDGSHRTEYAYNLLSHCKAKKDYLGNITHYSTNAFGKVTRTKYPSVLQETGDPLTIQTFSTYNAAGLEETSTDGKGFVTQKTYNAYGKPTKILYPDGTSEKFVYYRNGLLSYHMDAEKVVTSYTYDFLGREKAKVISYKGKILSEEKKSYSSFHLISEIDAEGFEKKYTYDYAGRKKTEEKKGEILTYEYDTLGRIYKTTYGNAYVVVTIKDLLDRTIEERVESLDGELFTKTIYTYDLCGNRSSILQNMQGGPSETKYLYDSFHRLTQKIDPLGAITSYQYLKKEHLQKIETNPASLRTEETFDALGRLQSIVKRQENILSQEEMFYDASSHLTRQLSTIFSPLEPPKTVTTYWVYNSMNRLESLTEAYGTPLAKTTKYTYTPSGLLQNTIKPDGIILTQAYNHLKDRVRLSSSDHTITYSFTYNKLHHLLSATDENTHASLSRKVNFQGKVEEETLIQGQKLQSEYDPLGRRVRLLYPDQSSVEYQYNGYFLSQMLRKDPSQTLLYTHEFLSYDLSGNLLHQRTHSLDIHTTYDLKGRRQTIEAPSFFQKALFNPNGTVSQVTRDGQDTFYKYDGLEQILSEEGPFSKTYLFDSHYSRLQKDTERYTINALHQMVSTYTYDKNGNPLQKGPILYRYDALDRLIEIENPSQYLYRFTYDPLHRRVSTSYFILENNQWTLSSTKNFLYDGDNEIGSLDTQIQELRILAPSTTAEINASVTLELQGKVYIPIHDLFGNIIQILSPETQKPQEVYYYTAFGEEKLSSPSINPWRFSSKRTDPTGLIFFGRRFYDPDTGRFLTPDPQGFTDSQNLYAFVLNDPLLRIDLYGLEGSLWDHSKQAYYGSMQGVGRFAMGAAMGTSNMGFWISSPARYAYHSLKGEGSVMGDYRSHKQNLLQLQSYGEGLLQKAFPGNQNSLVFQSFGTISETALGVSTLAGLGRAAIQKGFSWSNTNIIKVSPERTASASFSMEPINRPATSSMSAQLLKNRLIAEEISGGHAYMKHVVKQNEFPGFSQVNFEHHIRKILNNPTEMKALTNGRTAYWDKQSETVIVRDPFRIDGGTAFRPISGKKYYDDVLK